MEEDLADLDIKLRALKECLAATDDSGQLGVPSKAFVQHAKDSERTAKEIVVDAKKDITQSDPLSLQGLH